MAAKKEDDVEIIRSVLTVNNVQVVGSLAMDKLQLLLGSLCDRIASQAIRLDKAEEQGKTLASLKEEFTTLSQKSLAALEKANSDKEAEAKKQANALEAIESRLKKVEELMEPFKDGKVLKEIGDMPKRVSVVETSLQGTNKHVDDIDSELKKIDTHVHEMDKDLQELDSEFTNKESKGGGMDTTDLTERIKLLEAQIEEFQELMNQITKAHTADLEAIQKVQRTLRTDLEAKPLGQGTEGGDSNKGLAELTKRLERKADVDVVEQLLRASSNTKDGLETLTKSMEELKKGIRKSARFSIKMDDSGSGGGDSDRSGGGGDDYSAQIKKLEDELKSLASGLSSKADRATIDDIQFKLASGGGGGGGDGNVDSSLKDLIAKKVDRSELQELIKSTGGGSMKDLMDKIDAVNNSVVALAERSDLAVLLAKRAEQIAHPAAIIHGSEGHTDDEEIQFVVNEHANRIMVYADMLLQMQVVLATKADNSALSALREIVEKLQAEGGGASKAAQEEQAKAQEQMNNTIKSHEKMIVKILEDVGLLGKGVLIMSGHDDEFHPDNVLPSPALTISTQGAIPSTPNSTLGTNAKSPTPSSPQSPTTSSLPSSPPPQTSPPKPRTSISKSAPPIAAAAAANPPPPPSAATDTASSAGTAGLGGAVGVAGAGSPPVAAARAPAAVVPALHLPATLTTDSGVFHLPPAAAPHPATGVKRLGTPSRKASRFGSPGSTVRQGSVIHITNVQEASQVVADSKYHETLSVLEDAINSKKLEPKENVAVLKGLVIEVEKISLELENYLILIDNLEQNKVDKIDFQSLAKIVKELKAMENAMLSGKPLLGFKCMSCTHDLERLSPVRGPQVPTNQMPRSFLSMLSAERIFSMNKRDLSPPRTPPQTPPPNAKGNEPTKSIKKRNVVTH